MAENRRLSTILVASCPPGIIKAAGPNTRVSTDIQAHTQANMCWACTQGHTFKYSHPGSGPLRAKGTESLVLGTQLLVVLGWAMPPGPGEVASGETLGRAPRDGGFHQNEKSAPSFPALRKFGAISVCQVCGFFFF